MGANKRIQKLRKERHLSQAMLAEMAGLKAPAISQYESGARSPSFESLVKLSNALGVSTDYLLIGEDSGLYEEVGDSLSRLISRLAGMLPFDKREMLLDYAIMLLGSGKSMIISPYFSNARSYADHLFQQLCGSQLPVDIEHILKMLNVTLTTSALQDCEGMLIKGKENMIFLDQTYGNSQRQRFTIANLLGHLVLPWHTDTIYKARELSSFKTEDPLEIEALQFAAYLLMPREVLEQDLQAASVSLDAISKLAAEKYEVSVFALANSLVDLHPEKYAVVQSEGLSIIKVFQGLRPIKNELDPRSLAAKFVKSPPKDREMRAAKLEEEVWFQDGKPGAYILEESVFDPQIGKVLTLLTLP